MINDSKRMQRVVVKSKSEILLEETPRPVPARNEILVATLVSGVCGSDIHAWQGHHPFVPLPYNPGHEVVGIIKEIGADVTDLIVGQRVTVEPTLPCWNCKRCKQGEENLCENLQFFGCVYDQGGMAQYFTIPANRVHLIPSGFSDEEAALIEPLATPVHAVRLAALGSGDLTGKSVAILGAGTIGLLTLAAAKHFNAKKIVMTDLLPSKRERALRLGANAVLDATRSDLVEAVLQSLGESADVVFDCVSVQSSINQAITMALKGGTVVVVGVPAAPVTVPLPLMQDLQIRLQGSATYLPIDFAEATAMIQAGEIQVNEIVTAIFPMESVELAFQKASSGEQVKVLVRFATA